MQKFLHKILFNFQNFLSIFYNFFPKFFLQKFVSDFCSGFFEKFFVSNFLTKSLCLHFFQTLSPIFYFKPFPKFYFQTFFTDFFSNFVSLIFFSRFLLENFYCRILFFSDGFLFCFFVFHSYSFWLRDHDVHAHARMWEVG